MAASAGSEDGEMGFQIAPMVDVVFVLMLFFMAITGFKAKEYMLDADLPSPPKAGSSTTGIIRIDITEPGAVMVNDTKCGEPLDHALPELRAWLSNVKSHRPLDPVLLRPAPGTEQARIIDVL